jgi:hypothetical protein
MQSVPITTIVVSTNPAQTRCTRYNFMWWSLSVTWQSSSEQLIMYHQLQLTWCLSTLFTIFQLYRSVSFIGGGNRSTWRKPLTCCKASLWQTLSHNVVSKGCTRSRNNVYQLLAHSWWFSPGTPAFSTTKTGRQRHFQQYFSYIVVVNFIDGGNRSTWRKPLTCCKASLWQTLSHNVVSSTPLHEQDSNSQL